MPEPPELMAAPTSRLPAPDGILPGREHIQLGIRAHVECPVQVAACLLLSSVAALLEREWRVKRQSQHAPRWGCRLTFAVIMAFCMLVR